MIDYEKSFKKLVEQIHFEYELSIEQTNMDGNSDPFKARFNKGMVFAYGSIDELATKLENDEFFE